MLTGPTLLRLAMTASLLALTACATQTTPGASTTSGEGSTASSGVVAGSGVVSADGLALDPGDVR